MRRRRNVSFRVFMYLLETGRGTPAEVSRALGISYKSAYSALERLEKVGLVRRDELGDYVPSSKLWVIPPRRVRRRR